MRDPAISLGLRRFFQSKLDQLKLPPWISGGLRLKETWLGSATPRILDVRPLPSGGFRARCRVSYGGAAGAGDLRASVATRLDLTQTGGWAVLERALQAVAGSDAAGKTGEATPGGCGSTGATAPPPSAPPPPVGGRLGGGGLGGLLRGRPLRRLAADGARRLAGGVVDQVGALELELRLRLARLDGILVVWIAPPPSRLIWYGFEPETIVKLECRPIVDGGPVASRAVASRIAELARRRLTDLLRAHFVLPNVMNVVLPGLLGCPALGLARGPPPAALSPRRPIGAHAPREGSGTDDDTEPETPRLAPRARLARARSDGLSRQSLSPGSGGSPGRRHDHG